MDFNFTEGQSMLRRVAKEFAENEVKPVAAELDADGKFPDDLFRKMAAVGFTGLTIPTDRGGSGGNEVDKVIVIEEIAKKCLATAATLSIHLQFPKIVNDFGTEEQKEKYLPPTVTGGKLGAFALTEPNAGSDAASARTTAILDEATDEYSINGTKCFISGGSQAEYITLFALTKPEASLKGMSCILVERGTSGFSVGKVEEKMGIRASETAELIFENCRVPRKNLIGREGEGFKIAMSSLDGARISCGAQGVGLAEGAIEEAVRYAHERVQFGKPIDRQQGIQWYLADMATKTEAAKWLVYRAAYLRSAGLPHTTEAAMAKLNAAENARFVVNLALQIHGGYGYMKDYPLERMYRDAKILEIYEGTSEIHKVVISRAVLNGK
jgi:alkylation response protein AidB-like acyl-CoA dehydrogenase